MTPYMPSASVAKPTTPPPSYQSKDAPKPERKQTQETSSTEKSYLAENDKDIPATDDSAFAEMMAALLNMPSLAQPTPPVITKAANDIAVTASTTINTRPASLFNMDPALLILPQDMSAASLTPSTDGSFSTELIAALTPGIPAQTDAAVTSAVSVPILPADTSGTPSLTVDTSVEAEPRLIASGLDPVQLGKLQEKVAETVNPAVKSETPAPVRTTPVVQTAQASPTIPTDAGIITVTLQAPESTVAAPVTTSTPVGNVAVAVATQMSASQAAPMTVAVTATLDAPVETEANFLASIEPGTEEIQQDTGFDPLEFRIAQRFQRPAAQPAATSTQPVATPPTQQAAVNADSSPALHAETRMKGKIPAQVENTASLSSTLLTTTSANNLTAAPVALPVTVTPMTIASSPVAQGSYASQAHPAIQTVAAAIAKNAKESGPQTISIRLDPPELGKLQVEMKYKKGDPLKVHVVLEKADTANMFQKDAYALENALKDAGVQMDGSSLSFEFSQNNNAFRQTMDRESASGTSRSLSADITATTELADIETSMDIFTDNKTGLTRYNLRV